MKSLIHASNRAPGKYNSQNTNCIISLTPSYVYKGNFQDFFLFSAQRSSWTNHRLNGDVRRCNGSQANLGFEFEFGTWWRHQMETFTASLVLCKGNSPVTGGFPSQRSVTRSFDVFFDLRLKKRLSKQSRGWWFETQLCSLWRHRNEFGIADDRPPLLPVHPPRIHPGLRTGRPGLTLPQFGAQLRPCHQHHI